MLLSPVPLIVELDEILMLSNLRWEKRMFSIRKYFKEVTQNILKDSAYQSSIDVSTLPYCESVLSLLKDEYKKGREIILLTNNDFDLALQVSKYLGCITKVEDVSHCSLQKLQEKLLTHYGDRGVDFIGHVEHIRSLVKVINQPYIVNRNKKVTICTDNLSKMKLLGGSSKNSIKDWLYELRLHQWVKNLLIFTPMLTSHQLTFHILWYGLIAFVLFGLCSSSAYLINDLLDLPDDRGHYTKKNRPFAAGRLAIKQGLFVSPVLFIIAMVTAVILLPIHFVAVLFTYYMLTLAYSLLLKQLMAMDVVVLAVLYTLRIIAGGAALNIVLTSWILAFSIFIFLSLALVKRYTELNDVGYEIGENVKVKGRGYYSGDLSMIASLGAAAGYLSVMVLALYINSPQVAMLYTNIEIIWLACPILLFWVTRIWLLAHRGELCVDPVVFAIKDKVSLLAGALFILVFWMAI